MSQLVKEIIFQVLCILLYGFWISSGRSTNGCSKKRFTVFYKKSTHCWWWVLKFRDCGEKELTGSVEGNNCDGPILFSGVWTTIVDSLAPVERDASKYCNGQSDPIEILNKLNKHKSSGGVRWSLIVRFGISTYRSKVVSGFSKWGEYSCIYCLLPMHLLFSLTNTR